MRVFKLREFAKTARKAGISDDLLRKAVVEIEAGKIDASLGSELIKQRVARAGGGKSGGFRTLLAFRKGHRCVFVDIFAKNEEANISDLDLLNLRAIAQAFLGFDDAKVEVLVASGGWLEME